MHIDVPFIAIAYMGESGAVKKVTAMSNVSLQTFDVPLAKVPTHLMERIVLLKMCDVNRSKKGEVIGRRFSEASVHVYLSWGDYSELLKLKGIQP
jgi:hypothetical protein